MRVGSRNRMDARARLLADVWRRPAFCLNYQRDGGGSTQREPANSRAIAIARQRESVAAIVSPLICHASNRSVIALMCFEEDYPTHISTQRCFFGLVELTFRPLDLVVQPDAVENQNEGANGLRPRKLFQGFILRRLDVNGARFGSGNCDHLPLPPHPPQAARNPDKFSHPFQRRQKPTLTKLRHSTQSPERSQRARTCSFAP